MAGQTSSHRERARAVTAGRVAEAARLISLVENDREAAGPVLAELFPSTGNAHVVGVTGPPGSGKSTLVAALVKDLRARDGDISVGVVAVDPSSPFTGGALLGDRDRMTELALDPKVFVRSLAARGHGGGLCAAVSDTVDVMDAMGKDVVLVETVGVGQGELEIAQLAHTVVLVLVPGYGDSLQTMKAGITEIADLVVVNKSDTPGADETAKELAAQHFERSAPDGTTWPVPVVAASARRHTGIGEIVELIAEHRSWAADTGTTLARQRARRTGQVFDHVVQRLADRLVAVAAGTAALDRIVDRLGAGELDPDSAAAELLSRFGADVVGSASPTDHPAITRTA